ncbi:MAG: hypothetical protein KY428_06010 [Bacteroidetes bacterium]|nr:hypothetical protein [Bacteroidota bacterium]
MFRTKTTKQGDAGVGSAIAYFTSLGKTVSIPLSDSQEYDLVVDEDGRLKKVQVKTTYSKPRGTYYYLRLSLRGGNWSGGKGTEVPFEKTLVDYLYVLTEDGSTWLIPSDQVGGAYGISLSKKYDNYKIL